MTPMSDDTILLSRNPRFPSGPFQVSHWPPTLRGLACWAYIVRNLRKLRMLAELAPEEASLSSWCSNLRRQSVGDKREPDKHWGEAAHSSGPSNGWRNRIRAPSENWNINSSHCLIWSHYKFDSLRLNTISDSRRRQRLIVSIVSREPS